MAGELSRPSGVNSFSSRCIQFDPIFILWICPITEVVSLLSNAQEMTWIFHGEAKLEDWS
jgi:hypothetical protein